jgi:S-disulfanyl-L-cysteine oxidoreductase SoxD
VTSANRFLSVLLAGAIGVGVTVAVARGQTTATPSVLAGAYTEEQAIRGQTLYASHCSQCHGESLAGLDQAPPLVGPQFNSVWNGVPLLALVVRIDTMPPDKPGSLTRAESVDLLSFMLWFNGLPFGEQPLGTEQSVLAKARFETPEF